MKYRTLGKTGIRVSELTIGAWQLGGPLSTLPDTIPSAWEPKTWRGKTETKERM